MVKKGAILLLLFSLFLPACRSANFTAAEKAQHMPDAIKKVVAGAIEQQNYTFYYKSTYEKLDYPNGDVSKEKGVCSDVVVRAFRKAGVDLQKEVYEDINEHFAAYPQLWGHKGADPNIDHRRVPNLMRFFERKHRAVAVTNNANDYWPGDVVVWRFNNGLLHMGIVTDKVAWSGDNFNILHNVGAGAKLDDRLFHWEIVGHYRYFSWD